MRLHFATCMHAATTTTATATTATARGVDGAQRAVRMLFPRAREGHRRAVRAVATMRAGIRAQAAQANRCAVSTPTARLTTTSERERTHGGRWDHRTASAARAAFAPAPVGGERAWPRAAAIRSRAFAADAASGAADIDTHIDTRDEDDEDEDDVRVKEELVGARGNWGESSGRASREPSAKQSIEGQVFRPRERLKTNADFDRVKREGRTFNGAHIRVRAAGNATYEPATCTRIGIVVPKKQVKRAVDRNLLKRRIRHVFRTNKDRWPVDIDFIVFVNASALEAGFEGVRDDLFAFANEYVKREAQASRSSERKFQKRVKGSAFEKKDSIPPSAPKSAK